MYGHGAAPPHRSTATVITLRVLIAAAGFLSCGLLSCVPLFRVAVLRGRLLDWVLAWVSLPLSLFFLMVIGALPEADPRTDVALYFLLSLGALAAAYYLTVDIRHARPPYPHGTHGPQSPYAATMHAPGGAPLPYGYPQPASPYAQTAVPQPVPPQPPRAPVPHHDPSPPAVPPVPPPRPPGPARIDQVRAELDELSDYLRRSDGGRGPGNDRGDGWA
ncbi:hypothetical protein [Streptomyces prasinopilosus]|uniref:Integral membrane protein n=1 Tax=Streptomyces prasinopilosus TaxID=67344 RepID=A0A1G6R708_9ACTN|nr:hypothetical protein [Streptomyces prasinopilosus]SDD00422.1 hypothetical protein SAMN05216505_104409 [Streptomyces prasinopilosus]